MPELHHCIGITGDGCGDLLYKVKDFMHDVIGTLTRYDESSKGRHSRKDIWHPLRHADTVFRRSIEKWLEAFARKVIVCIEGMLAIEYLTKKDEEGEEDEDDRNNVLPFF